MGREECGARREAILVRPFQAEQHGAGQPYLDLYEAVAGLKHRPDLHPCSVRPRDGVALRRDGERKSCRTSSRLTTTCRPTSSGGAGPPQQPRPARSRRRRPHRGPDSTTFREVARLVLDPISQGEAHHNVYRAALERRDWGEALAALRRAAALDAEAFEPFPLARFEPVRILGAGGFGPPSLSPTCEADVQVVVKALRPDGLDRDLDAVFHESARVQELDHPALIRVRDCAWADAEKARPYLVLEYLEGQTLMDHVARHGPLAPEDWMSVAWQLGRGLQALHGRGVLHRSLRPAAVLVRREKDAAGAVLWRVKLLDAGLSLKRTVIHASASNPAARVQTALGRSVARTIAYAAPEVIGKPKGQVWVGPHSDVYAFGKLCAFALTGRPEPDGGDLVLLPEPWKRLLDDLTGWTIPRRLPHFGAVLDRLSQLPEAKDLTGRVDRAMYESTIADHTAALSDDPGNFSALVHRGDAYARQGDFDQAVADYTLAIQLRPDDAALYRRRGLAHARRQAHDKAVADYTEAVKLEPRNPEAYAHRALAHAQRKEYDQAIADYTEALRLNPRDEALYYNRGNAHYCKAEYDRAIADYTEAARLDPRNAPAFGNRGKAHALRGEHGKAVADFGRLLHLDPANVRAMWDRALSFIELGQYDKALADYDAAIRLEPSAALYRERGQARAAVGDLEQAIADFTEALAIDPQDVGAHLSRAGVYHDRGEFREALADLNEALRRQPDSAVVLARRGDVQGRLGALDEALADYTRSLELKPDQADVVFRRGNVFAGREDLGAALADYTAAIRLNPDAAAAYINRGNVFARLGDGERARADYTEAIRLDPTDAAAYVNRAAAYADPPDPAKAVEDYSEAIRLNAGDADVYNARGGARVDLGDLDGAVADFGEAVRLRPDHARAFFNRGCVHARLGELDEAVADFSEALRIQPDRAAAFFNRGCVHARRGDPDAALADFGAAIRLEPSNAAALNNRGGVRLRQGDAEAAGGGLHRRDRGPIWPLAAAYRNRRAAAQGLGAAATGRRRWPTTRRRCGWTPTTWPPTTTAAGCTPHWATTTRPSRTIRRPCGGRRTTHGLSTTWPGCGRRRSRSRAEATRPRREEYARKAVELRRAGGQAAYLDTLAAACAAGGKFRGSGAMAAEGRGTGPRGGEGGLSVAPGGVRGGTDFAAVVTACPGHSA